MTLGKRQAGVVKLKKNKAQVFYTGNIAQFLIEVQAYQIPSLEAEARTGFAKSAEKSRHKMGSECAGIIFISFPVCIHHNRIVSSYPAEARVSPAAEKEHDMTYDVCPFIFLTQSPVRESQTLTLQSLLPVAKVVLSQLQTTSLMPPLWPSSVRTHFPVSTSHSLAVLSPLALAAKWPSRWNLTDDTHSLWPSKVCISL